MKKKLLGLAVCVCFLCFLVVITKQGFRTLLFGKIERCINKKEKIDEITNSDIIKTILIPKPVSINEVNIIDNFEYIHNFRVKKRELIFWTYFKNEDF